MIENLHLQGWNCSSGDKVQGVATGGHCCGLEVKMLRLKGQDAAPLSGRSTESAKSPQSEEMKASDKCEGITRLVDDKRG